MDSVFFDRSRTNHNKDLILIKRHCTYGEDRWKKTFRLGYSYDVFLYISKTSYEYPKRNVFFQHNKDLKSMCILKSFENSTNLVQSEICSLIRFTNDISLKKQLSFLIVRKELICCPFSQHGFDMLLFKLTSLLNEKSHKFEIGLKLKKIENPLI